ICSSVNRAFICPSFCWADSTQIWRSFRGSGHPVPNMADPPPQNRPEPGWRPVRRRTVYLDRARLGPKLGLIAGPVKWRDKQEQHKDCPQDRTPQHPDPAHPALPAPARGESAINVSHANTLAPSSGKNLTATYFRKIERALRAPSEPFGHFFRLRREYLVRKKHTNQQRMRCVPSVSF
ncbi:hypothetical protein SAMN04488092_1021, partial [Thalassovita taeanensis]